MEEKTKEIYGRVGVFLAGLFIFSLPYILGRNDFATIWFTYPMGALFTFGGLFLIADFLGKELKDAKRVYDEDEDR